MPSEQYSEFEMLHGARTLNQPASIFGLNAYDLIGSVGVMIVSAEILRPVGLDFLSVVLGSLSLVALIPIRLKYRRRIIRDSVLYFLGGNIAKGRRSHVANTVQRKTA